MTWTWVSLVLGLAFIYAVLFLAALHTVAQVSVRWARDTIRPYEPADFRAPIPESEQVTEIIPPSKESR